MSTNTNEANLPTSAKDKLKKAVKDYGSTVIVFHVSISLMSLGTCYLLVSRYVFKVKKFFLHLPCLHNGHYKCNYKTY